MHTHTQKRVATKQMRTNEMGLKGDWEWETQREMRKHECHHHHHQQTALCGKPPEFKLINNCLRKNHCTKNSYSCARAHSHRETHLFHLREMFCRVICYWCVYVVSIVPSSPKTAVAECSISFFCFRSFYSSLLSVCNTNTGKRKPRSLNSTHSILLCVLPLLNAFAIEQTNARTPFKLHPSFDSFRVVVILFRS